MLLRWLALTCVAIGLAGCVADTGDAGEEDADSEETASTEQAFSTDLNCADPAVMKDGATYVLTCTGFRIFTSTDLKNWQPRGKIFPAGAPAWTSGNHWAAEIHHVKGGFGVYFTAKCGTRNCVGAAFNTQAIPDAAHPYQDLGGPLIPGGLSKIDPHVFKEGDDLYIYWKAETGSMTEGLDTIWGAKLSDDGRRLVSEPKKLMTSRLGTWEWRVIEGPSVMKARGYYYLFYSGNVYSTAKYAVGVARSRTPLGDFDDNRKGAPILDQGRNWIGPGHNTIARGADGKLRMIYHAFRKGETASDRKLLVTPMGFDRNNWPVVHANL